MPKFTANVHVHGPDGPVFFAEGDELPDWAIGLVGVHVLDGEPPKRRTKARRRTAAETAEPEPADGDESDQPDEEDDAEDAPAAVLAKGEVPDFTAAPSGRGAARKG